MEFIKKMLKKSRSIVVRRLTVPDRYWLATKSLKPLSVKFGFDRGTPIDRFWIEDFLIRNKRFIKGVCLEVTNNYYSKKFGGKGVSGCDVLDINEKNNKANIHGDLRNLRDVINDNTYDCVILTHVLGLIDDVESAVKECQRILKPGGTLLATSSCFSPVFKEKNFWSFKPDGFKYLFSKAFNNKDVRIYSYGNVLAGQCFWAGMAQEEMEKEFLEYNDPRYPCIVAVVARKNNI